MGVSYARELHELHTTLAMAIAADPSGVEEAVAQLAWGPARCIGTGGTLALARLAADLHEAAAREPSRVMTPMEFVQAPRLVACGAVLFSARAKHPDALLALAALRGGASARTRPAEIGAARPPS